LSFTFRRGFNGTPERLFYHFCRTPIALFPTMRCLSLLRFGILGAAYFIRTLPLSCAADSIKPIEMKLTMIPPRDILVEWKDPTPGAVGHIVEWGTKPDDEFVPLGYFPPTVSSYRHPDLMWETPQYYRVRAYYGPASPEIEVSLPKELTDAEYKRRYDQPEDYHWAPPKIVPDVKPVAKKSLRDQATAADAAPVDFKSTLQPVAVSGFQLTWTDRASDEEGTMVEVKKEGSSEWQMVAMVPPDVNSFGWAFEPPTRKALVRIRPYYFGPPCDLQHLTTGKEPEPAPESKPTPSTKKST
jgi:hypothetical protein